MQLQEMAIFLDEHRLEPALEQMPDPFVSFVEPLRIEAVQLPHAEGRVSRKAMRSASLRKMAFLSFPRPVTW